VTVDSDSARFSQALRSAIFWPLAVFGTATLLLLVFIAALLNQIKWSTHSYQVLVQVHTCENDLIRGQDNVRGYLLTGDKSFADEFEKNRTTGFAGLTYLQQLVSDNPTQTHNARDMIDCAQAWSQHAGIMLSQRTSQTPVNPDWLRLGDLLQIHVRQAFDHFTQEEVHLRDQRLQSARHTRILIAAVASVLAALLVFTIIYQVRRQMLALAASYRKALDSIEQRQAALVRSEQDLENQKEWLHVTLTSIGDGVMVTDAMGRIILMNHEAEKLTGWPLAEALHHPLSEVFRIVSEETRATVPDPVAKVLMEKKTVGLANHTLLISRSAEERPIEDSAAPIIDGKGETLGVVLVFHDATNTRLAQKSLQAYSTEMEKTVAERTVTLQQTVSELQAFSYSVSHDLRSPLRAMQGFADALLEDYTDKIDEHGRDYLDRIKAAALRLDRLIADLHSYTLISRDDAPLEALDLDKIVRDIIEAESQFHPPMAMVQVEGRLLPVLGRESALSQVVTNLLANAVKFVPEGSTPQIRIWSEARGARVRLWIEDKGLGISREEQERIFDMFVQLNEPAKYGGTGIGLAIVKKAMQIMHGEVGVESEIGSGSRFWLELGKAC